MCSILSLIAKITGSFQDDSVGIASEKPGCSVLASSLRKAFCEPVEKGLANCHRK